MYASDFPTFSALSNMLLATSSTASMYSFDLTPPLLKKPLKNFSGFSLASKIRLKYPSPAALVSLITLIASSAAFFLLPGPRTEASLSSLPNK